ncbi:MAG: ATP-binding cassette domain-containing protein [Halobacteriota archaeon]|jgi:ABC-2 type transport system ATP-binding protein
MTEQLSDHTTDAYALQVQGLTKRYGDLVAVDDLSLQIKKEEIFGFLGPNGAGKTTAINMMVGLLSPTGGAVLINGQDRARVPKRSVGVCPQELVLWEELTCVENLTLIGDMYDLPRVVTNERVRSLLADLALSEKAKARVSQLSGGMKRRLNVALAVVHDPDIVVLDEPSSGLDPQSRLLLWDFIRSLKGKGKTTILTTHAMEEADALSDRVAIIDHGKLLQLDTPQNLKRTIGSGDIIEIQLAEPERNETVIAGLKSVKGIQEIKDVGGKINVRALNAVSLLPEILERVDAMHARVSDIAIRENTLEDVFIYLTGRGLRE